MGALVGSLIASGGPERGWMSTAPSRHKFAKPSDRGSRLTHRSPLPARAKFAKPSWSTEDRG
eukprot:scaffold56461_cov60-Phaeocystis_antarctica.AAC.10